MRKDKVAKIVKWVAVWCTVLAVMYLIGYIIALNYQTRTSILQAMEANQTATIEIHSPFMTMDFIKKVVQQHNKEAKKGDCYSVYLMTEESCWISSPNSFRKSAAGFRLDLVHSSFAIEEGTAVRREISFTYATTEQEEVFHESIEFWKEFVEEKADMQITAKYYLKDGGIVTKITVILTAKSFEEEGQWPSSIFILQLMRIFVKITGNNRRK